MIKENLEVIKLHVHIFFDTVTAHTRLWFQKHQQSSCGKQSDLLRPVTADQSEQTWLLTSFLLV